VDLLQAPFPVFLVRGEKVEANAAAQGLPLPPPGVRRYRAGGRYYQVERLALEDGEAILLSEVSDLVHQAEAYATTLRVMASLVQQEDPEALFGEVLRIAVETIPQAQAGTLFLRRGDFFELVAQVGYDPRLLGLRTSLEEEATWYGLGLNNWFAGRPRVLRGEEVRHLSALTAQQGGDALFVYGRVREIRATLGVPVVLEGEVLATLNLDNLEDEAAFTQEDLALAQAFALKTAVLLYGLKRRQALAEEAKTDPLTGLRNRRALEETFPRLFEKTRKQGQPLALIYWDLNGLKALNDRLGHAAGDQALKGLALGLRRLSRREDLAFRIGGDEFVSLHPGLGEAHIPEVIARLRNLVPHAVSAGGVEVESPDLEAHLREADRRMYRDKPRPR